MPLLLKAALIWLGLALMAALNGALRESLLTPRLGPRLALAASGLILCGMIFALTLIWLPHLAPLTPGRCWAIGAFWVGLTLAFELVAARITRGSARLGFTALGQIRAGKLMIIVLLVTLAAPYLAARLLTLI
jgi:hypothetical protein